MLYLRKMNPQVYALDTVLKNLLLSEKDLSCFFRCNCMEPHSPSNDTLKEWRESNLSASDIIWGNLTVSVSKTWQRNSNLSHLLSRPLLAFLISYCD
jgi:hypothetical protein